MQQRPSAMASFDDLQFSGLRNSTVPVHCSMCGRIVDVAPTALTCPAGHVLPPHSINPLIPHHLPPASRPPARHSPPSPSASSASPFVSFPALSDVDWSSLLSGGAGPSFLDMVRAQQGMSVDDLMQSLLSEPSYAAPPTSAAYLASLQEEALREEDFAQVSVRMEGVERDVLPTWAEFGIRLRHERKPEKKEEEEEGEEKEKREAMQEHVACELVMADPLDGKGLVNGAALKGRAALLSRGRIPFVDKCRAVQRCGALLALVQQTGDEWPFVMTDQAKAGKDISIPCLLISQRDGGLVRAAFDRRRRLQGDEAVALKARVLSRDRELMCPVCRENFALGESAIKSVPPLPAAAMLHARCGC